MNKLYMLLGMIGSAILLLSNSTNPPDGHTGAPGELFCANCHSSNGSLLTGTVTVEGFPAYITPDETYTLTVVNRDTNGSAAKGGFQMTILGPLNTKAGEMSMPSDSASLSMLSGRQYFEHHPAKLYPDSNVIRWTVLWKAPTTLAAGSVITWYVNGIIANGNAKETGDKTASAKGNGAIILSATENPENDIPSIYPNPGSDQLHIQLKDQNFPSGTVQFYNLTGTLVKESLIEDGFVNTATLSSGLYILQFNYNEQQYVIRWTKM